MLTNDAIVTRVRDRFGDAVIAHKEYCGELTIDIQADHIVQVARALRTDQAFGFEQLIDLCGVDYLGYGDDEPGHHYDGPRFAVVYHLLSVSKNLRLRLRVFLDDEIPRVGSVTPVWPAAEWYEREAFDLFGIVFDEHPDLRRLLTDYGFIGHPFRKDFPLIGRVEMRYDPEKERVVYEPVAIEPRVLVPRVIREEGFGDRDS